ncbi:MAG: FKBP-type peptidyl-prolyl cis-trans isomerase [Planctomycetota bacterium]
MKTRVYIVMLALGCLAVLSVFAAQEGTKETTGEAEQVVATVKVNPPNPNAALLKTEMDKVSYIIGTQIARNFKTQDIEVNVETLAMGLKDALEDKTLALGNDEMQKVYAGFQARMRAKQAAKQAEEAAKNAAAGSAYLEANKTKEGVKVLPSGLQYKVITEGTGKSPTAEDKVKTNYRGKLIDGTEFDSSYKRDKPLEISVNGVIKGWTEALQLMKEGSKWELYIPADLAYGSRPRPGIPANSTLVFEVELLEVLGQ